MDECVEKFISRFAWVKETLEKLSKKSKNYVGDPKEHLNSQ